MKMCYSPVKEFALEKNLEIYQPEKVKKNTEFIEKIKELNQLAKKDVITFLDELDQQMINKILSKKNVIDYILKYGKDKRIKQWILNRR